MLTEFAAWVRAHAWIAGPVFVAVAYLGGSVCFGLLYARRAKVDLRAIGSGNVGATNVGRALGKGIGRKVLLLDLAKGVVPTIAAVAAFETPLFAETSYWPAGVGLAAAVGHAYPIWFGFRGGKAAATSAGAMLGLAPWAGVAAIAAYLIGKKWSGRASVGSLAGSFVGLLACVGAAWVRELPLVAPSCAMAAGLLALVVWRHTDNIQRLWRGEEPRSA